MKSIIIKNQTITTTIFLKNLVELNQLNKYRFINQSNYITIGIEDTFNFKRCHDFFLESICLFFGDEYENPKLSPIKKKRGYTLHRN